MTNGYVTDDIRSVTIRELEEPLSRLPKGEKT
jgi:hypothetical protein